MAVKLFGYGVGSVLSIAFPSAEEGDSFYAPSGVWEVWRELQAGKSAELSVHRPSGSRIMRKFVKAGVIGSEVIKIESLDDGVRLTSLSAEGKVENLYAAEGGRFRIPVEGGQVVLSFIAEP